MMLLQPGAEFAGRYEIVRVLSTGGMGVVYEVLHRDTQRKRALKLMLPSLLADDDMRARFAREATVTAAIESEHLVEVFDAGVDKETGCPFLVMELLRGEDLGARLTRAERTSPRDVLYIFDQLTRAIVRTHEAGIVHRDLKPENVFVTKREDGYIRMKILDFGIAKLVDRGGKSTRSVGTPIYMAPEQMTGKGVGASADLYALGQIAFTLLVGQPYFMKEAETSENVLSLMYAVGTGTVDPATMRGRELGVELPAAFDAWFARATHRDATSRFASAKQQLDALHGVLDSAPDVLPVSSGAVRRQAAFGATEAMTPAPAGSPAAAGLAATPPPLAPASVDRSAAPARTHLSAPMLGSQAGVQSAQTTGGPSSRTLRGDSAPVSRSRVATIAIAVGVVAAASIAIGIAVRSAEGTTAADPPGSAIPEAAGASSSTEPRVAPSGDATSPAVVPEPPPSASVSPPASASVATAPSGRPAATPGSRGAPPRPSASSPSAPPTAGPTTAPAASTHSSPAGSPAGPAPTIYQGPRR
jgi:serine/threonine protein kinase